MFQCIVTNDQQTEQLGVLLAEQLPANSVILLQGDLGAGKTTFTKGIARGLGITQLIKSPTYTLVRSYTTGRLPLHHFDVYRLEESGSDGLGFEDYFEQAGICVVEWSQFIQDMIPSEVIEVSIERVLDQENARKITIQAKGARLESVVENFKKVGVSFGND